MAEKQKAVVINGFGGIDKFHLSDIEFPAVKPGFVRIKLFASSFNPVDYKIRKGNFGGEGIIVLGHDGAGEIDAVGEGVTRFKPKDKVYTFIFGTPKSNGAYAQYVSLPQEFVAIKPNKLSFIEAASIPLVGLTAYEVVKRARVVEGSAAFVTGASGGVGSLVVQLLRAFGAKTIVTTAGSDDSAKYIQEHLGIPKEHILRYDQIKNDEDLVKTAIALSPNSLGFPASIDLVGGRMKKLAFHVIKIQGNVVTIVEEEDPHYVTPLYPSQGPRSLFMSDASFHTVFIGGRALDDRGRETWHQYAEELEDLAKLLDENKISPPKVEVLGPLSVETVQKAHKQLEGGHTKGKLIMLNSEEGK